MLIKSQCASVNVSVSPCNKINRVHILHVKKSRSNRQCILLKAMNSGALKLIFFIMVFLINIKKDVKFTINIPKGYNKNSHGF